MYLLDTDVAIWLLRGRGDVIDRIEELSLDGAMCLSVISVAEIYKNVFPVELTRTEELIDEHQILNVDIKIAKAAGWYWQTFSKKLRTLSLTDCLIAATARVHNCRLVTINAKHFPMTDIEVSNPLD